MARRMGRDRPGGQRVLDHPRRAHEGHPASTGSRSSQAARAVLERTPRERRQGYRSFRMATRRGKPVTVIGLVAA